MKFGQSANHSSIYNYSAVLQEVFQKIVGAENHIFNSNGL